MVHYVPKYKDSLYINTKYKRSLYLGTLIFNTKCNYIWGQIGRSMHAVIRSHTKGIVLEVSGFEEVKEKRKVKKTGVFFIFKAGGLKDEMVFKKIPS